jgi:hypothetical protein
MPGGFLFDEQGARRIISATRKVERYGRNETGKGRRWPLPDDDSSSVGIQRVVFTIDSYDSDTGVARCTVRFRPYGFTTVTGESGGKIDVEDPAGCYFDEEEYDLVDRWGHADLMAEDGDTYGDGVWIVSGLCCPET